MKANAKDRSVNLCIHLYHNVVINIHGCHECSDRPNPPIPSMTISSSTIAHMIDSAIIRKVHIQPVVLFSPAPYAKYLSATYLSGL